MGARLGRFHRAWLALVVVATGSPLCAQSSTPSPLGIWHTIDDRTGKVRGTVRVFEQAGELFARIETAVDPKEASDICDQCTDERKNKPILGMVIMRRMKKIGNEWSGGDVLDPDTGSIYKGKMRLIEGGQKLVLRGFIGISLIGRSQTWLRQP